MKDFVTVAKVNFVCPDEDFKVMQETIVLTEVDNYTDAIARIEEYYGDDLDSIELSLFEGPFFGLSEAAEKKFIEKGIV